MAKHTVGAVRRSALRAWRSRLTTNRPFDVLVVGGGPAGLAAASVAAEAGQNVALVDETPWLGGQIWRGEQNLPKLSSAQEWFQRFAGSGATRLDNTCVVGEAEPGVLLAERESRPISIRWKRLILASGARELFLPFPGWTLPGVIGPGGLLSLVKNGWPVQDKRVVIAGTGPLLLAAAAGLAKYGARIESIIEQADWHTVRRFGLRLLRHQAKLWQGVRLKLGLARVPQHFATWPIRAEGTEKVQNVTLTDGKRCWTQECDLLACGFGLVPNSELPLALGCQLDAGFVRVNALQATSVSNIYCAGEPTGIGGADCALIEGQIAGYAAVGKESLAKSLFGKRAAQHRFRGLLAEAFRLRSELKSLAENNTLICRCEDVSLARLRPFNSWREAKLHARCGMGPCQGRVCGPATQVVLGWGMDSVRPPVCPAKVGSLISTP